MQVQAARHWANLTTAIGHAMQAVLVQSESQGKSLPYKKACV
jgi:hypothetical protein